MGGSIGTNKGEPCGYRDNANPDAFEMDNLRTRVYDVETKVGELKGRKLFALVLAAVSAVGLAFDVGYAYRTKHAPAPCKDALVEIHAGDKVMSCPHVEHRLESVQGGSTAWAIQCMCQR